MSPNTSETRPTVETINFKAPNTDSPLENNGNLPKLSLSELLNAPDEDEITIPELLRDLPPGAKPFVPADSSERPPEKLSKDSINQTNRFIFGETISPSFLRIHKDKILDVLAELIQYKKIYDRARLITSGIQTRTTANDKKLIELGRSLATRKESSGLTPNLIRIFTEIPKLSAIVRQANNEPDEPIVDEDRSGSVIIDKTNNTLKVEYEAPKKSPEKKEIQSNPDLFTLQDLRQSIETALEGITNGETREIIESNERLLQYSLKQLQSYSEPFIQEGAYIGGLLLINPENVLESNAQKALHNIKLLLQFGKLVNEAEKRDNELKNSISEIILSDE